MKRIMIAYVPVLHAGYLKLFERYAHMVECLYVFGSDCIAENSFIAREIRALEPETVVKTIEALKLFPSVRVLDRQGLFLLKRIKDKSIILTADEVSRAFAEANLPRQQVMFDTQFLRWDEKSVCSDVSVKFDRRSSNPVDTRFMRSAHREAQCSSCWWRQVGAVVVNPQSGKMVLSAHNRHLPDEHTPYAIGDPRDFVKAGTSPEIASTIHAEAAIVAAAAREGIALRGKHLYVTVFPCSPCAGVVADSGISALYFASGCAYLEGEGILRSKGIEIVYVA